MTRSLTIIDHLMALPGDPATPLDRTDLYNIAEARRLAAIHLPATMRATMHNYMTTDELAEIIQQAMDDAMDVGVGMTDLADAAARALLAQGLIRTDALAQPAPDAHEL